MDYRVCDSGTIKDTGTMKGRGVFAIRQIRAGETIEICPVILVPTDWSTMPEEVKHKVFDWGYLTKDHLPAVSRSDGAACTATEIQRTFTILPIGETLSMIFTAARDIELGEELTVNYNGVGGNIDSSEDDWFD